MLPWGCLPCLSQSSPEGGRELAGLSTPEESGHHSRTRASSGHSSKARCGGEAEDGGGLGGCKGGPRPGKGMSWRV